MTDRTALGVYIFAGGFTLGVKRAGFRVMGQLEDGPYGVATTRLNHPDVPVHPDPASWPLDLLAGQVDFVYGNPPCAPFSNSGVSTKKVGRMDDWWRTDPRAQCVQKMFTVLERVKPAVWAWESVQPALRRGRELVDELTLVAKTQGYAATYVLLDAAHLGVPQRRRRLFVVFHKVAIDWRYPGMGDEPEVAFSTVRDAWEPLLSGRVQDPELAGGNVPRHCLGQYNSQGILDRLPQGGSLKKLWEKENPEETRTLNAQGKVKGRPGFLYKRLAWDGQSPTLTGSASKTYHPETNRYITVLEKQLLCGYPETYEFVGSPINKLAQIAQAVMPPVGEWLGRNVMRALEAGVPADPDAPVTLANLEGGSIGPFDAHMQVMAEAIEKAAPSKGVRVRAKNANFAVVYGGDPVMPSQMTHVALWEQYSGPTALARVLIADGHGDGPILASTRYAVQGAKAAGYKWPRLFTRIDLARLRARILKGESR